MSARSNDQQPETDPEVQRVMNVLHVVECAMRNIRVSRSDPRLAEYNRFRSELMTLRERGDNQPLAGRGAPAHRLVHVHSRSSGLLLSLMGAGSLEDRVRSLRNDRNVSCMFCQKECDASKMKFYHLFGLPKRPQEAVACDPTPDLDGYNARKWLKADFAKLEKLCVEFVRCYDRPEAERKAELDRALSGATKQPPAEFLGAFALGSECAQYFEATMYIQSFPMVEAHDVQIMVVNCLEDKSNDIESINDIRNVMFKDECEAESVTRDLRGIRDFVAGRRNVRLPDIVGPARSAPP